MNTPIFNFFKRLTARFSGRAKQATSVSDTITQEALRLAQVATAKFSIGGGSGGSASAFTPTVTEEPFNMSTLTQEQVSQIAAVVAQAIGPAIAAQVQQAVAAATAGQNALIAQLVDKLHQSTPVAPTVAPAPVFVAPAAPASPAVQVVKGVSYLTSVPINPDWLPATIHFTLGRQPGQVLRDPSNAPAGLPSRSPAGFPLVYSLYNLSLPPTIPYGDSAYPSEQALFAGSEALRVSRANSQKATDEIGVIGKGVVRMDKATQDSVLLTFDNDIRTRGEEIAWFLMASREATRNMELMALVNRGTYGDYSGVMWNFNKWNSAGTPAALLPPGFQNPR